MGAVELFRNAWPDLRVSEQEAADEAFAYELFAHDRRIMLARSGLATAMTESLVKMQYLGQTRSWSAQFPAANYLILKRRGLAIGRFVIDSSEGALHLVDINLAAAARGQGIGGTVLDALIELARRRQVTLQAHVAADNPAMNLYLRKGFVMVDGSQYYHKIAWKNYR